MGRDWALRDKWTRSFSVPVYEWIRHMGLANVRVTPVEFCTAANVDTLLERRDLMTYTHVPGVVCCSEYPGGAHTR